jgi:hypothetical protein
LEAIYSLFICHAIGPLGLGHIAILHGSESELQRSLSEQGHAEMQESVDGKIKAVALTNC